MISWANLKFILFIFWCAFCNNSTRKDVIQHRHMIFVISISWDEFLEKDYSVPSLYTTTVIKKSLEFVSLLDTRLALKH